MAKSTRKKADSPADSGTSTKDNITDIPHEEVPNSKDATPVEAQLVTVEDQIKLELAKFNVADAAIAQLKEAYGALVITGPDDKKGYEAVKKAWNEIRSKRTGLEKKGKELRSGYTVIAKAIGAEEDRLIELINPLEEDLYKKWKAIDDEKERVKKEKEEAEQAQLMARVEEIQTLGMTFADGFYQIGGTVSVDVASLRAYNDEQYEKLKGFITARKAELDKAAEEKAAADKAEQDRRDKEAADLKKQQDELREQQAELQRQKDELEQQKQEAAKLKRDNRIAKVTALGMTYNERSDLFEFDNGFKSVTHEGALLFDLDEYGFTEHTNVLAGLIKESKDGKAQHDEQVRQEQAEKERLEKFIAESLESIGMTFSHARGRFIYSNTELDPIEVTWNDFVGMDDAAIATKAHELGDQIADQKAQVEKIQADRKAEQDRKDQEARDEQARQDNLALSDRDRFFKDVARIEAAVAELSEANYKTKKFKTLAANLKNNISQELENAK